MPTNPNMVAIQTVTVGAGGAASISFTSIPQTYTDLKVVLSVRGSGVYNVLMSINSSSSSFSYRLLEGDGSTAASYNNTTGRIGNTVTTTASTFSSIEVYIPNYTGSTNKSYSVDAVSEANATTAYADLTAGLWSNTSAITALSFAMGTGDFAQYSSATLYGVTSAGYGAKATGGIITQDANYYYHTFLASGTFTPTSNITADYLVVAGGGGGGVGGGGAGGLRCTVTATGGGGSLESALSLTASTNYTVTIGGGGAGQSTGGNAGSNSVFSSITSTGGGRGGHPNQTTNGDGGSGGSGGGGASNTTGTTLGTVGAGTTNQGYAGGLGTITGGYGKGGGGGAGAVGAAASTTTGGNGGAGVATSISGSSITYAGGGGGGSSNGAGYIGGTGGAGGGGNGGSGSQQNGLAATANTGSGGGGSSSGDGTSSGGNGGSGIVIVRYAK